MRWQVCTLFKKIHLVLECLAKQETPKHHSEKWRSRETHLEHLTYGYWYGNVGVSNAWIWDVRI